MKLEGRTGGHPAFYKLTVYAASAELAESFIKELSIVENTTGERLSLKLERKNFLLESTSSGRL